jgi:type VI secretion system protein ImpL
MATRLFSWWHLWRVKAATRPPAPKKPALTVHEDDAAFAALIAAANAALAKAPNYAGSSGKSPLSRLPLYLLIGPEGAGKTTTFLNAGVEPQLLAGEQRGPAGTSTRLCNIWLAKNALFVEIAGRVFTGDRERWIALLSLLRGIPLVSFWRRFWQTPAEGLTLRGVVGFSDVKELTGAAADPQRLERGCREWQEHLRDVGEVFGVECPVYQVFTKCDKVSFFSDFFGRLPESEVNQILGCTLPYRTLDATRTGERSAEAEAKRLSAVFRPLYHSLAERRLSHLAHEPNPARKAGIYEFPRELKRIRGPLLQFLTDVFRPHPLAQVPVLRGFYLTAIQEVETAVAKPAAGESDWTGSNLSLEATRLFRAGDATEIFKQDEPNRGVSAPVRGGTRARWIFTSDLFHQVVLADRPPILKAAPTDAQFERFRLRVCGAICGACILLCLAFVTSWASNRELLSNVADAGRTVSKKESTLATLADLRSLEQLRHQVVRLQNGETLRYRWGLYTGNAVQHDAEKAYFSQFRQLLLTDLDEAMLSQLRNLSLMPGPTDPYEPAYDFLKTHLTISSGSCKPDPGLISRTLKQARTQLAPDASGDWQDLANRQINFYASALPGGNPCRVKEDVTACDRARTYLEGIKGAEPIYRSILSNTEHNVQKSQQLEDLAPNYRQVLSSKAALSSAFSPQGWRYVQDASKKAGLGTAADPCVGRSEQLARVLDNDRATAIQGYFIRDYIKQWRDYIAGFSVLPYKSPADAAQKLSTLAGHNSPLLALFALTGSQTNFPAVTDSGVMAKITGDVKQLVAKGKKKADQITGSSADIPHQPAITDVTQAFQPVDWVVPPGSPTWVVDRNAAYSAALLQLGESMQAIAASSGQDAALYQAAGQNQAKAFETAKQLESGFKPIGVDGLDSEVQRLLEEPIRAVSPFIVQPDHGAPVNRALAQLCGRLKSTLRKYPFQAKSSEDTTLPELSDAFAPTSGAIWKFATGPLSEFAVRDGAQWKSKDPAKTPQVTPELLLFLGRAQSITTAFFSANPNQPGFSFTLRPNLVPGDEKFELRIGGTPYLWTDVLQKSVTWPGSATAPNSEAIASLVGPVSYPFDSRHGPWGIFRIIGDAEPRALMAKTVEWRYSFGPEGKYPITPAPVRIDIVQFPADTDVFNPRLYEGLSCPSKAVQ